MKRRLNKLGVLFISVSIISTSTFPFVLKAGNENTQPAEELAELTASGNENTEANSNSELPSEDVGTPTTKNGVENEGENALAPTTGPYEPSSPNPFWGYANEEERKREREEERKIAERVEAINKKIDEYNSIYYSLARPHKELEFMLYQDQDSIKNYEIPWDKFSSIERESAYNVPKSDSDNYLNNKNVEVDEKLKEIKEVVNMIRENLKNKLDAIKAYIDKNLPYSKDEALAKNNISLINETISNIDKYSIEDLDSLVNKIETLSNIQNKYKIKYELLRELKYSKDSITDSNNTDKEYSSPYKGYVNPMNPYTIIDLRYIDKILKLTNNSKEINEIKNNVVKLNELKEEAKKVIDNFDIENTSTNTIKELNLSIEKQKNLLYSFARLDYDNPIIENLQKRYYKIHELCKELDLDKYYDLYYKYKEFSGKHIIEDEFSNPEKQINTLLEIKDFVEKFELELPKEIRNKYYPDRIPPITTLPADTNLIVEQPETTVESKQEETSTPQNDTNKAIIPQPIVNTSQTANEKQNSRNNEIVSTNSGKTETDSKEEKEETNKNSTKKETIEINGNIAKEEISDTNNSETESTNKNLKEETIITDNNSKKEEIENKNKDNADKQDNSNDLKLDTNSIIVNPNTNKDKIDTNKKNDTANISENAINKSVAIKATKNLVPKTSDTTNHFALMTLMAISITVAGTVVFKKTK